MLPPWENSVESGPSVGVGGASDVIEGDRRCLLMYEAEECDRGSRGLPVMGDRGGSSLYEEVRLTVGVLFLDEAGDCCVGGVYGIAGMRRGW